MTRRWWGAGTGLLLVALCLTPGARAQEPPQGPQSYDQWALQQEWACRATLKAIWEQGNAKGREVEQLKQEKQRLEAEIAYLKERRHVPDADK